MTTQTNAQQVATVQTVQPTLTIVRAHDFSKRLVVEDTGEYSGHVAIFAHGGESEAKLVSVVSDKYTMVDHADVMESIRDAFGQAEADVKFARDSYWSHGKYFKGVIAVDQQYDFGMPIEKSIQTRTQADSPWSWAGTAINNKTHDMVNPIIQVTNSYSGKDSFKMFMGFNRQISDSNVIIRFPKHEYEADLYSPHLGNIQQKIADFLKAIPEYMERIEAWKVRSEQNPYPATDYDKMVARFQGIFSPQFALKAKQMLDEAMASGKPMTKWLVLQIATYIYNHDINGVKAYRDYNLYNRLFA